MDITKPDVLAYASELASTSDLVWEDVLKFVNEYDLSEVAQDGFNTPGASAQTVRMARIFLAAHIITKQRRGNSSAVGPLTSESVGGIRRSWGMVSFGTALNTLTATGYGQQYLEIIGAAIGGPMLV